MFNRDKYGKIIVPMVTPFKEDQSVDYEAAVSIAERLAEENKADSIILSGTTGEFHAMNFEERIKLFEVVMEAMGDKIPLIAGTGATSTIETIALSKKAEEMGFELLMVLAPYYVKPNQKEIYNHFKKVAAEVNIPIILYNIPIFTGVNIDPDILKSLAEEDNIVGIKEEAELNPKQVTEFINVTSDDFLIYNGDDTMIIEAFAQGGEKRIGGVVSGASHLMGERIREMIDAYLSGQVQKAADMQQSFLPLYRTMGMNDRTNPVALLKEAMKMMGYKAGLPRLPLSPGSEEEKVQLRKIMEKLELI